MATKLLCVNDVKSPAAKHFVNWIKEGEVYTVRRTEGSLHGLQRVLLNEITNPKVFVPEFAGYIEPGFDRSRFKEVDDLMNIVEESKEETLEKVLN